MIITHLKAHSTPPNKLGTDFGRTILVINGSLLQPLDEPYQKYSNESMFLSNIPHHPKLTKQPNQDLRIRLNGTH